MRYATQTQMAMFPEIVPIVPMDWIKSTWKIDVDCRIWICTILKICPIKRLFKLWKRLFHFKTFIVSKPHLFWGESLKARNNNICIQDLVNICSAHRFIFVSKGWWRVATVCRLLLPMSSFEEMPPERKTQNLLLICKHLLELCYDRISNICCGPS